MQASHFFHLPDGSQKTLQQSMFAMIEAQQPPQAAPAAFPASAPPNPPANADKTGYMDHMNDPDGDYMAAGDIMRKTQGVGGCATSDQSFPVRLHYMLNEIEGDGLSDVISWAPHGRCKYCVAMERYVLLML